MNLEDLKKALYASYARDLCYPSVQKLWSEENKCFGMCTITALIVQDYFGGKLCKMKIGDTLHYFNWIDGEIDDFTASQFENKIEYENYQIAYRKQVLKIQNVKNRYDLLKERVVRFLLSLLDLKVHQCIKCEGLVEKFPEDATVFLGINNDIVLIGEAPANNGWRKSHMLWRDVNGKLLPSGVVLQKLFDIIGKNILETTFLESVKCFPLERKNLKTCSSHCKSIMLEQLKILNPKLVITLGEFPTRNLLNFKFEKFLDVVGNLYEVENYKVLPIYHPSPISPKSYSGNLPIFEALKEMHLDE